MTVAIQAEKQTNGSKVIHLNLKVVKKGASNDVAANHLSAASFLKDFAALVQEEMQKSVDCIALIKEDINHARTESQVLRKQFQLESSEEERTRILNKIAVNKAWMAECEEHIILIKQRALVLQAEWMSLQVQSIHH